MNDVTHKLEEKLIIEIASLERRFDEHLKIYANNGKESKRVADLMVQMIERAEIRDSKVDAMWKESMDSKAVSAFGGKLMTFIIRSGAAVSALIILYAALKWASTL